ncbi:acyl-CoA N-acyltransferase [Tricharina praecox]|uniref:acyl-CoA N-acyltransferase n=1 Tax=Tricharina praecox TaxID=43433 RepID=UPI0022206F19|nr:acyl-CoA N-acyltransferase [Tricharina praecox]KAI5857134.1 acyl-CoA N-acyltransferase [Tricharina praecox]
MAEPVDLASLTFARLPGKSIPASARLLAAIKQTEKRTFPGNEAFDFDSELKKRTTVLHCVYHTRADGPELCGYTVHIRSKLMTRIHKVCVVEPFREQGIGKWMVGMVLKELKKAAAENVDLWVDTTRVSARRLYEACGFKEVQIVRNYYSPGRDGIRMERNLEVDA